WRARHTRCGATTAGSPFRVGLSAWRQKPWWHGWCAPNCSRADCSMGVSMTLSGVFRVASEVAWNRRAHGVSYRAQSREFQRFNRAIGSDRGEFLRYWLWDQERPLGERLAFLSNRERIPAEPLMNPREGSHQIRDKAWATAQLESAGLGASGTLA